MNLWKKYRYGIIGGGGLIITFMFVLLTYKPQGDENQNTFNIVKEWFGLLSTVSITFGISGIYFSYRSYVDGQKNNNFTVVNGCMTRYHTLLPDLIKLELNEELTPSQQETTVKRYFDLTSEQLYYIGVGFIPSPIEWMWIRGMREQIKVLNEINPGFLNYTEDYRFLTTLIENPTLSEQELINLLRSEVIHS